tara:strand:+ start:7883 stop:9157 length:1275 start_codon:yes stop_codon:yes gene_type:complete
MESERGVLGAIMTYEHIIDDCRDILTEDMFYRSNHKKIFHSACLLRDRGDPIDQVTIAEELIRVGDLEKVGHHNIASLAGDAGAASHTTTYAKIVRDDYVRRTLITRTERIRQDAFERTSAEELLSEASAISTDLEIGGGEYHTIGEVAEKALAGAKLAKENPGQILGFPTGNRRIDDITNGFQRTDQIILAGRPGMGKSAIAWNLARAAAESPGNSVLWINLEMSNFQIGNRALASEAEIDSHKMRRGLLGKDDFFKLPDAAATFKNLPIYLDEKSRTLEEVRASIRKAVKKYNIGYVVIDYLQLVYPPKDSYGQREQDVAQISAAFKAEAKRQNICILLLSQLSRSLESRKDKRPILSDLRESGAIEQDADMVIFVYRDSYYDEDDLRDKDACEICIAKQRSGPTGTVTISFNLTTGRISER